MMAGEELGWKGQMRRIGKNNTLAVNFRKRENNNNLHVESLFLIWF